MEGMASASPEKGPDIHKSPEALHESVSQPTKVVTLQTQVEGLGEFVDQINKISEKSSSSAGEQWSGGTGTQVAAAGTQQKTMSARDLAIANLPTPQAMQKELEKHIREEVKNLRKQAKNVTRVGQPGGAHRLTLLYRQIRHLNSLLSAIWDTSVDVVKRLFIRVFVDKQSIQ